LVLEALDHADAVEAATALSHLDPRSYRSFNLIVADNRDAFWLRHADNSRIDIHPLADGLSLIAAGDLDETETRRLVLARPRFAAAPPPDPDRDDWAAWETLLGDPTRPPGEPENAALRFFLAASGFGTVSSALVALPATGLGERKIRFRHAAWLPEPAPWQDVLPG
jgi:hypothetical protein